MVIRKSVAAKPEQDQDEELALPERQQPLQHRDRALAVRALPRHPAVDRQRAEQGQRDQHQGGDGREQRRRRARRCPAGSRGWRSSRRRSGTSPSTSGASCPFGSGSRAGRRGICSHRPRRSSTTIAGRWVPSSPLQSWSPGTSIRTALSAGLRQEIRDPHQVNREIRCSRIGSESDRSAARLLSRSPQWSDFRA